MKLLAQALPLALSLAAAASHGAELTLHATDIPASTTTWTTADGRMTFESAIAYTGAGTVPGAFGGASGGNNNAYDNADGSTMTLRFEEDAGLREIGTIWSRASAVISGFAADPGMSVVGGSGASATYDPATGNVTLSQPWNGGTVIRYLFANPGASAGRTLLFTFAEDLGGSAGYQFALNRIVYQDSPAPPVIATGLPETSFVQENNPITLSVNLAPGTLPLPTYLWEFRADSSTGDFIQVGTSPTLTLTNAQPSNQGTYRVTVTNPQGSDQSTGSLNVQTDRDNDGLINAYETNTGIYVSPTDTGTDPDNPDTDGDGLTDGAEVLSHGTNPTLADTDGDGLGDALEINTHNTNPLLADTDGDGLTDHAEILTHQTDPLLADSDEDGYSDGWEVNQSSSDPLDAESPTFADNRRAIGVAFSSAWGEGSHRPLEPTMWAGLPGFRQQQWNRTSPAGPGTGTELEIESPQPAALTDSAGLATSATLAFSAPFKWRADNETQTPYGRLFGGYLDSGPDSPTITISIDSIPYARYDVLVYVGSAGNGRTGSVTLNGVTHRYTGMAVQENGSVPTWNVSADSDASFSSTRAFSPAANVILFRGVTGNLAEIVHQRGSFNGGVFAVQIVEDPDSDGDGMGDFYESSHGLNPALNDASADADNDGLSNLAEHDLGTRPDLADTDNDGLNDGAEWNSHDTNPFLQDTDADGLNDGPEVNLHGSDPLVTDSDLDGYLDGYEANTAASSPTDPDSPGGPNPPAVGVAFDNLSGEQTGHDFHPATYAGAAAVRQKNWNRSQALPTGALSFTETSIAQPASGQLTDSRGNPSPVTFSISGAGVWSDRNEQQTPYGRLFNAFVYNDAATPSIRVDLASIPYSQYEVHVYMGADFNGRTGTVAAGSTAYSFTSASNATSDGGLADFVESTSATGNPQANHCVFRNLSGSEFTFSVVRGSDNVGLFGFQIVDTSGTSPGYAAWAAANAGGQGPDGDFDGDGISNLLEYALLTNPQGQDPSPGVITGALLSFNKRPEAVGNGDLTYSIETSTTLEPGSWQTVTPDRNDGSIISWTLPAAPGKRFARLLVSQAP